jgi:hypothetical protein
VSHTTRPGGEWEQTEDEAVFILDRRLGSSLSEFDEQMLRETERARAERPAGGEGAGGVGTEAGSGSRAGEEGDGETRAASGAQAAAEEPQGGAEEQTGPASSAGQGKVRSGRGSHSGRPTPPGIPDGSDDDVVARQLREAAESETDPALKERLWEEYRKYKEGG